MPIQLIIVRDDDGSVKVGGPLDDKLFCYGLLECARDAIRQHNESRVAPRIVPATIVPPNGAHKGRG